MSKKSTKTVRFTCASSRDPISCTTVTAERLGVNDVDNLVVELRQPGKKKTVKVPFYANRIKDNGTVSTYRSTYWPSSLLPVPDLGEPVELEVVSIS